MADLTSKHESFITTMQEGDEFARYGFELLVKQEKPEKFFEALIQAGFFDPKQNSGPVPAEREGSVRIPFWTGLDYLLVIAKRAGELNDPTLAEKVLKIVRDATSFRQPDGKPVDNYQTFYRFAEMMGALPLSAITEDDVNLAPLWLDSRFDHGLVATALSKGLLQRFLASNAAGGIKKACVLMKHLMAFRWLDGKKAGRDLVSVVDEYWLKEIVNKYARDLGAKAGSGIVQIFEDGLRDIFSDSRRSYGSSLWRPAIEDSSQNTDFRGTENRHVEGMRDSLAGWIETKPAEAVEYVARALTDDAEIIRRVALHTVTEYFELLRTAFEASIDVKMFSSGHRHELYRLLKMRFSDLSADGKKAVVSSIRALTPPKSGEEPERRLKFTQREWLTAISSHPEVTAWFAKLSSDPVLGPASDHPDFLSYHETWSGPGPSPFGEESLVAFAEDGTIVDRLHDFQPTDSWRGPTLGGLVAALEGAVANSPNVFLPLLSDFKRAKIPFQHAIVSGLKRVFDSSASQKSLNWKTTWSKLMIFFNDRLSDETFWASKTGENADLVPTRAWMASLIASFLEAGTKDDKTAYPPELLPTGWEIIKILLARAPIEAESATDPMTHALNTEKGRAIGAMYNHALRVCRVAKQKNQSLAQAWATVEPVFNAELAKCKNANFEFSTLSASYIANLEYMSHDWLKAHVGELFPHSYPANFKAALGGLAYATPTRKIYQLVSSHRVLEAVFEAQPEDGHSRERVTEWICLAYLWGEETLDAPLMDRIFFGGEDDLLHATEFFWRVKDEKLASEQLELVVSFWAKVLEWAETQPVLPIDLLARLSRLAPFLDTLNDRGKRLLLAVVPYVHSDYSEHQIVEQLNRLADTNSEATVEILERMFAERTPHYDIDDKLKALLTKLYDKGHHSEVLRCVERLRKTLPGIIELYKKLGLQASSS